MKVALTNRRRSPRKVGRLLAVTALLSTGLQVAAACPPIAATSNRSSLAAHMLELSCSRETAPHANFPTRPPIESHMDTIVNRWSAAAAVSAANIVNQHSRDSELNSPVARSLSEVHWADSHDWISNPPEWVKAARNYRRQGMPIIHLMQSKDTLVALGVSNHGKPGLYFTRKVGF